MQPLEKRIAALEKYCMPDELVIFIILVGVGQVGMEITHLHDNYGNEWSRRPSESEVVFKERATSETPRTGDQGDLLFGTVVHTGNIPICDCSRTT